MRAATSKLQTLEELEAGPSTLGFRGEALCSLADVALVEIVTCVRGSAMTYRTVIKVNHRPVTPFPRSLSLLHDASV